MTGCHRPRWFFGVLLFLVLMLSACAVPDDVDAVEPTAVLVATQDGRPSQPVVEVPVTEVMVPSADVPNDAILVRADLEGFVLCRPVKSGEVITRTMLAYVRLKGGSYRGSTVSVPLPCLAPRPTVG